MKKLSLLLLLPLALLIATNAKAEPLQKRLKGQILLQVEQNGEAWYLSPANEKRYYMGRPNDAFQVMREQGIGISNDNLNKIPASIDNLEDSGVDSDGDGHGDYEELKNGYNPNGEGELKIDKNFAEKQKGKIFLQVEGRGEAWYINPSDAKRYYLGRPVDAFRIMRKLGLGINDANLETIAKMTDVPSSDLLDELKKQKEIKKFESREAFAKYLEENNTNSNNQYYGLPGLGLGRAIPMEAEMNIDTSSGLADTDSLQVSKASSDYSKTNVQVSGVDEADIIKSDGDYIYALVAKTLYIVDAYPAQDAKIVSEIAFKDQPQNIYIRDDKLVVFGQDYSYRDKEIYKSFIRRSSYTFFKIFDISDRTSPKQVKDLNIEGYYSNSRMIGDYVYFITNNYNYRYYENEPVLPRIVNGSKVISEGLEMPNIYYFDIPYTNYNAVSISVINIANTDQEISRDIYLLESGQNFYVSNDNIYLTYTKYFSEYDLIMDVSKEIIIPRLSEKSKERIEKINDTDNDVLSKSEKQSKINEILQAYSLSLNEEEQEKLQEEVMAMAKAKYKDISKELEKTVIHKIAIDKENLEYKTNAEVTGRVLNQFSMDQDENGYFRIATTRGQTWSMLDEKSRLSYNNLYILDDNLKPLSALENLAEDERIKSVRFMQDRAYMVTFKQIDPLFVIDLSDPLLPKVLGELKIPGYSDYLHPFNDNILIGLGKDAYENESGRTITGGVKISLFDVSDVASPKEIDNYIMGGSGSYSPALNDHKAFYFDAGKDLLGLPIVLRGIDKNSGNSSDNFNGAYVFDVSEDGFSLKGKISHKDSTENSNYYYSSSNVSRILHIDNVLYTFSNQELKMNQISDLEEVNTVEFSEEGTDIIIKTPIGIEPMIDVF